MSFKNGFAEMLCASLGAGVTVTGQSYQSVVPTGLMIGATNYFNPRAGDLYEFFWDGVIATTSSSAGNQTFRMVMFDSSGNMNTVSQGPAAALGTSSAVNTAKVLGYLYFSATNTVYGNMESTTIGNGGPITRLMDAGGSGLPSTNAITVASGTPPYRFDLQSLFSNNPPANNIRGGQWLIKRYRF